jgi:hypothetical protein
MGGPKVTTQNISYSISMALMWGRGPLEYFRLIGNTDTLMDLRQGAVSGVPDPAVPGDDGYDHTLPPDAQVPYTRPTARLSGSLTPDGMGGQVGTGAMGNFAGYGFYEGNDTQLPDSVVEADLDARYGADSTPAFRKRGFTRLSDFYLDRWQGGVPVIQTVCGHKTLKTLAAIGGHFCDRTGVLISSDYDFSALRKTDVRGFIIGQKYKPADVMEKQLKVPYNVYYYETDKIYGNLRGGPITATIPGTSVGWVSADSTHDGVPLSEVDSAQPTDTQVTREYDFKFLDPDKDFEQNSQSDARQVTQSEQVDSLDIPLTMYAEEARAVTQRELYRAQIEAEDETFTLDWSYIWLKPGDSIEVDGSNGFTYRIFIKTIKPAIDVIEVTGVAEDTDVFNPKVATSGGIQLTPPPVPIPGMTVVSFGDFIALRAQDEGQSGFYAWAVRRTGDGQWTSAALFKEIEDVPDHVATFSAQATAGTAVVALGPVSDLSVEDTAQAFTANASTDAITPAVNNYLNGETVVFSGSGTMPGGLTAGALYYVVSSSGATFKVATTAGGSSVNITSAGSGTILVGRVVDVDLYGTEAAPASVTPEQIAQGANAALFGDELTQVRTWQRLSGFPNRWRASNFTRGLRGTVEKVSTHTAGDRFVQLDDAVVFVPQNEGELNISRTYRAVTQGQSYDDAAPVLFTWTGGTVRYQPVAFFNGQRSPLTNDIYYDWMPAKAGVVQEYLMRFYDPALPTVVKRAFLHKTAGTEPLMMTRDDLLSDGTPSTSFGDCSSVSSVATDGSYTVSTTGADSTVCRYVSQELRGDCIIQFEADTRSTPSVALSVIGAVPRPSTIDPTADTVTITGNDLEIYDGQQIAFRTISGSLPGGTVANAFYFIINYDGEDTFQVSTTAGGAPLNFTSAGSAVLADVVSLGGASITTQTPSSPTDPVVIMPEQASLLSKQAVARESYAMEITGRQARYYVPWTGDLRTPTFKSSKYLLPNPFRITCGIGPFGGSPLNRPEALVRPRVTFRAPNAFTYTRAMQNNDFNNSPPGLILCEIRQVSYVGDKLIEGLPRYVTI